MTIRNTNDWLLDHFAALPESYRAEAFDVADLAFAAFAQALTNPGDDQARVDLSNALNYLKTLQRQGKR